MIRGARIGDIDDLLDLEAQCFSSDRLTRRSFRHLLREGHSTTFVAVSRRVIQGYAMLLFRKGTKVGRLYSIAVDPRHRGQGVARRLMHLVEREARARDCRRLVLEVRPGNRPARRFYDEFGFRHFARKRGFYEDGVHALRLDKQLAPGRARKRGRLRRRRSP
ncbi:MAG: GNAT family N-acetyltransferase [Proteobacteria bacterium]|nr:GNAT family N-acetyltransferase [Pseudomonadota bacterium]MBI3496956.1 GNAT family N-acetyltransferase [Pseudomonadota bacterium]